VISRSTVGPASNGQVVEAAHNSAPAGLTGEEARARLEKDGPNEMPDTSAHPLRNALAKFWAPVPWLLEASIVLETVLHKYYEAAVIAGLLLFNAALAYFQESRAQATLAALKSRLALNASVQRDGEWKTVPAAELVCGDLLKLSLGGVVAADVHLTGGSVELDQSMLTGESLPIDAGAGTDTFAGALVRRGEATAIVTATGTRTKFGRTAELVRSAHVVSTQQKAVLSIIRNLAVFNCLIIVAMGAYAYHHAMPSSEMIPLLLTSVLAIIPVALPATFTLAAAVGARGLAKLGVLPTRLSAVDEAASIDVLCSDKTGTLTRNELTVTSVRPLPGFDEAHVLGMAALASSEGGRIQSMRPFDLPRRRRQPPTCQNLPLSFRSIRLRKHPKQQRQRQKVVPSELSRARSLRLSPSLRPHPPQPLSPTNSRSKAFEFWQLPRDRQHPARSLD
jgi:H+-transporting ATPase